MEIYKNSITTLPLNIYSGRVLIDADTTPSCIIKLNGVVLPTHTVTRDATGSYSVQLSLSDTFEEGEMEVSWTFSLGSVESTKIEYHSVITPYVDLDYLYSLPNDDYEIAMAEKYARFQIEKYTNQRFGKYKKWVKVRGNNTDTLILPDRIIYPTHIYEQSTLVWNEDGEYTDLGTIEVSTSGFAISIIDEGQLDYFAETSLASAGRFKEEYIYEVVGEFGYKYVPNDITLAANILVDDWFCKDKAWREKYADSIKTGDLAIQFNAKMFTGTGNSIVDAMLSDYMWHRMVIV